MNISSNMNRFANLMSSMCHTTYIMDFTLISKVKNISILLLHDFFANLMSYMCHTTYIMDFFANLMSYMCHTTYIMDFTLISKVKKYFNFTST
jgi:H2-forming N5,N10-methylenetetrahydromethanopterin dehydrogenase-like enzyme